MPLQLAADQQVEFLVGAAQFDVCFQRNGVVALHQWVQQFVDGDRSLFFEALGEVLALEDPRNRVFRRELDHARRAERFAPLRVVADLGARRIENLRRLRVVGLRIGLDLLARERRTHVVAPGRVTDHRSEIADQKDDLMTQILHLAHLVQDDRMSEMDVGRRRVEAELDPQRLVRRLSSCELLRDLRFDQEFVGAAFEHGELLGDIHGHDIQVRKAMRGGKTD